MFLQFHGNINSLNSEGTNDLIKQGGRLVTSYEDIISHIKRYCLAKSKKTGDYFCLRGDNLEDVEAVNKVCEELMKRYANK